MTDEARIYGVAHTDKILVDFMLKSAIRLLENCGFPLNEINALDPFTGDGIFIDSLISHGIRKISGYEIRLEQFKATAQKYKGKASIIHVNTFSTCLHGVNLIIGNPPYGKCEKEDFVDSRIRETYGGKGTSVCIRSLYDHYVRAIRWGSDNLARGVIAYIVNNSFLQCVSFSNFRKKLENEYDAIYIVNLRGNHRTSGELCRQEGGNVFGVECRTGIAILFLVRNGIKK